MPLAEQAWQQGSLWYFAPAAAPKLEANEREAREGARDSETAARDCEGRGRAERAGSEGCEAGLRNLCGIATTESM